MRVGLLGGSFDPVHYGHLRAAQWALGAFGLDRILLVPARRSPFKGPCVAGDDDRLAMLRSAARENPAFEVEECELLREPPSFTVDTLRYLAARTPQDRFTVIVGSDAGAGLEKWREISEVRRLAEIEILDRPGDAEAAGAAGSVRFEGLAISATGIRETLRRGESIRYLTPESVRLYIEEKGLYK